MKRKNKDDPDDTHDDALLEAFMDSIEDTEEKSGTLTNEKDSIAIDHVEDISDDKLNTVEREIDVNDVEQASYEARIGKLMILSRGKLKGDDLNVKTTEDATDFGSRLVMEDGNESANKVSDSMNSISFTDLLRKKKKQRKQQEADFDDDINWH